MLSNRSNILVSLLVASMVAAAVATIELEVGTAKEPIEFDYTVRKFSVGPLVSNALSQWLTGIRGAVFNYLSAVSAADFSRSSLAWARETKVLQDALREQGQKMRNSGIFLRMDEIQESTTKVLKFFKSAMEDHFELMEIEGKDVQFSAKEVDHYASLLEELFTKDSDPKSLINIETIKIHQQKLGVIVGKYVKLLIRSGLGQAVKGLTSGLAAI